MPALRLLGRKWLAASDDLVFPSIFELLFRFVWLILIALVVEVLYPVTWQCQSEGWHGGEFVRLYLCGTLTLQACLMLLLAALAQQSARGTISETEARKLVAPLLLLKVFLVLPEVGLNVMGTMWMFCEVIQCTVMDKFSSIVIQSIVLFNWVQLGLTVFGLFMVFDPLGSVDYGDMQDTPNQVRHHRKVTGLWSRRFRWAFCWLKRDEHGKEAFQQVAALLSALFRSTDLVPSDVVAGCVLLRVRQKRETREMRRIQMLNDEEPIYTTDLNKVFSETPPWMNLDDALHYLRLSIAAYGWPYVLYRHCFTGVCKLAKHLTCCCCRPKNSIVTDDNCCLCNFAGVKYMANLSSDEVIFASFNNRVFELPFCVIADHEREAIVVAVRGSISLRDIFTDFSAGSEKFEAEGVPEDTAAHKGMSMGAAKMLRRLVPVLDRAFQQYPTYDLILTGHSLGAGVAVLVALKLRPKYPHLKVFAFSTPAGLISREAARYTESFVLTVGVGDDLVMRLSVHSIENLRTKIIQTIHATKLPKYRIMLNGFGYALFGVPTRDLESTWRRPEDLEAQRCDDSDALLTVSTVSAEAALLSRNVFARRFSSARLFTPGRILHIMRRKRMGIENETEEERKVRTQEPTYEMRWACPEDFMELQVMPRMLLDHLPENVHRTIQTVLEERHAYRVTHLV
ncbi:diacylglycerol lipase-beta isoform X1 [Aricia agestis]|uniref:diacylglycerol lipase-beta isoform X1 n=1 Tax=Aricia agestis TaxID=91739 RepID=UPI001C20A91C|nr:diacylglycerol lipase-beta isoform X1 [Aricia agestis]XP_041976958.1 diacylglycerol lipase-beta isoform X1 [Aricia agestis]XP_041976959.1 diacylglycerol lipase-beta isoform X1 [Aricia agestis]XP_041976960.1 diacylglycerol lipase-beta isoform X1 [Aricia agestis]